MLRNLSDKLDRNAVDASRLSDYLLAATNGDNSFKLQLDSSSAELPSSVDAEFIQSIQAELNNHTMVKRELIQFSVDNKFDISLGITDAGVKLMRALSDAIYGDLYFSFTTLDVDYERTKQLVIEHLENDEIDMFALRNYIRRKNPKLKEIKDLIMVAKLEREPAGDDKYVR